MKYRSRHILLLATLAALGHESAGVASAQTAPTPRGRRSSVSDVDFFVTGDGRLGFDEAAPRTGFFAPRGSQHSYLFGAGLWFGTVRPGPSGPRTLVFSTYNPNTGWSNATPGDTGAAGSLASPYVFHSVDYDRHGAPLVAEVPSWPLWLPTPADSVRMMAPGTFILDPALRSPDAQPGGAAFVTRADEEMVVRYNDLSLEQYEDGPTVAAAQGYPIGLQIQQNIYAWRFSPLRDALIIQYQIVNVTADTLRGCVAGHVVDPEIGAGENDRVSRVSSDPRRRTILATTDATSGDDGLGKLAMVLVEAPVVDKAGFIDPSRRAGFRQSGTIGVFSPWRGDAGPATAKDRYDAMTLPDWAPDDDRGPADQRMVVASDTFAMRPGDTAWFAVAYAVIDPKLGKRSVVGEGLLGESASEVDPRSARAAELTDVVDRLFNVYYSIADTQPASFDDRSIDGGAAIGGEIPVATPNPASGSALLGFRLDRPERVRLRLIDGLGRTVGREDLGPLAPGEYRYPIDLAALDPGLYLVELERGSERRAIRLSVLR